MHAPRVGLHSGDYSSDIPYQINDVGQQQDKNRTAPSKTAVKSSDSGKAIIFKPKEKNHVHQIKIIGLSKIFDSHVNSIRRGFWVIFLLTCSVASIYQIYKITLLFLSHPTNVNTQMRYNESLIYPAITICKQDPWNRTTLHILKEAYQDYFEDPDNVKVADFVGVGELSVGELWSLLAHNFSYLIEECTFGEEIDCDEVGEWHPVITVLGMCSTFVLKSGTVWLSGQRHNLQMTISQDPKYARSRVGYRVLVHSFTTPPLFDIYLKGFNITTGIYANFRVDVRLFRTMNRADRPCKSESNYTQGVCLSQCFSTVLFNRLDCTMPFMLSAKGKPCSKSRQYVEVQEETDKLLTRGQWLPDSCECPPQCEETVFRTHVELSQRSDREASKIRVYYQKLAYSRNEETYTYKMYSYLADLGGSLSLFLGASVLTILEVVEYICTLIKHVRDSKKERKAKKKQLARMGLW